MSAGSGTALQAILARTREHLALEQQRRPLAQLVSTAREAPAVRPLVAALSRPGRVNVIAEHKRRSPSRGAIREDLAAGEVARRYENAGAAALSVLTESDFFGGSLAHLAEARASVSLPVLRKDFLLEPWQVWEARAAGADAVLLIVAALEDAALGELLAVVAETGMSALVEVHERGELERALRAGARLVGVNNRDLRTLAVSLSTSLELLPLVPDEVVAVAESGIRSGRDLRRLRDAGADAFLVGESLMSAPCPGEALRELMREAEVAA
ncbi:MAG TPA: indole-3-glycerol phosphate synthase TrpC [Vicinamibacteria bacterium]|nr:indole-3-glycerol phosphate synthase TrpC [Vicinamibacteria bacterium]